MTSFLTEDYFGKGTDLKTFFYSGIQVPLREFRGMQVSEAAKVNRHLAEQEIPVRLGPSVNARGIPLTSVRFGRFATAIYATKEKLETMADAMPSEITLERALQNMEVTLADYHLRKCHAVDNRTPLERVMELIA